MIQPWELKAHHRQLNTMWVMHHGVSFSDMLEIGQSKLTNSQIAKRPAQDGHGHTLTTRRALTGHQRTDTP